MPPEVDPEPSSADLLPPKAPAGLGPFPSPEGALPLDMDLIKILASDTRLAVLRLLKERRMTVTELAKATTLSKATLLEHLKLLHAAGLIRRHEDERIWVYYELTRQGKRIINPGAARFYLVVGTAAAALVVGVALTLALQALVAMPPGAPDAGGEGGERAASGSPAGDGASLQDGFDARPDLTLLAAKTAYAGTETVVQVLVEDPAATRAGTGAGTAEVFLLAYADGAGTGAGAGAEPSAGDHAAANDGDGAAEPQAWAFDAEGIHLATVRPGEPVALSVPPGVPAGTYALYVRSADGRDNADAMPRITIATLEATLSQGRWWRGLDGDLHVALRPASLAATGTLVLEATSADGEAVRLGAPVVAGNATFRLTELDPAAAGRYAMRFLPSEGGEAVPLAATLEVREPQVAVSPLAIHAERPERVEVAVHAPGRAAAVGSAEVVVEGAQVLETAPGAAPSRHDLTLRAPEPGQAWVRVGRLPAVEIAVLPWLAPAFTAFEDEAGDAALELRVSDPAGTPLAGVAAYLDGAPLGFTNATGALTLAPPGDGAHLLRLLTSEGHAVDRAVLVRGWNVSDEAGPLRLEEADALEAPAGRARVGVALVNPAAAARHATVLARASDGTLAAWPLVVPANSRAEAVLDAAVPEAGPLHLTVEARSLALPPLRFEDRVAGAAPPSPTSPPSPPPDSGAGGASPPTAPDSGSDATSGGTDDRAASRSLVVEVAALPAPPDAGRSGNLVRFEAVRLDQAPPSADEGAGLERHEPGGAAAPGPAFAAVAVAVAGAAAVAARRVRVRGR